MRSRDRARSISSRAWSEAGHERLLGQDVLARLQRVGDVAVVQAVRRRDHHPVHVAGQQVVVIGVGRGVGQRGKRSCSPAMFASLTSASAVTAAPGVLAMLRA